VCQEARRDMATFRKRGDRHQAIVRVNGIHEYRSFNTKGEAKAWAEAREKLITSADNQFLLEALNYTVGDAIDRYIANYLPLINVPAKMCKSPKQKRERAFQRSRLNYLTLFKRHIGDERLQELTHMKLGLLRDKLREYTDVRYGKKKQVQRSNSTLNRTMTHLSSLLQKCVDEWSWLNENPCHKLKMLKEPKGRTRFLDPKAEYALLLKMTEAPDLRPIRCYIIIATNTGMRFAEIRNLEWKNVYFDRREILLRNEQTKTDFPRVIPLRDDVIEALKEMKSTAHPQDEYVFQSREPNKRAKGYLIDLRKKFKELIGQAGITNFKGHDMRHTFASYLAQAGESLLSIADLCGHKDIETTRRYAHLTKGHLHDSVKKLDKILSPE
jgi:integrase